MKRVFLILSFLAISINIKGNNDSRTHNKINSTKEKNSITQKRIDNVTYLQKTYPYATKTTGEEALKKCASLRPEEVWNYYNAQGLDKISKHARMENVIESKRNTVNISEADFAEAETIFPYCGGTSTSGDGSTCITSAGASTCSQGYSCINSFLYQDGWSIWDVDMYLDCMFNNEFDPNKKSFCIGNAFQTGICV